MKVLKLKQGAWSGSRKNEDLIYEVCSNPKCTCSELHYPRHLPGPFCPDCKTKLIGNFLLKGQKQRIVYHLEA